MTTAPSPASVAAHLVRAASEFRRRARRRLELAGVENAEIEAATAAQESKIQEWQVAAVAAALRIARENY